MEPDSSHPPDVDEAEATSDVAPQLLRQIFDAMPQLGWTARADGFIDHYNQGWYAYTGTTAEDMRGWGWTSVHDPAHLPRVLAAWQAGIASGQPLEIEFPLRRHDGVFRWFLTRVVPIRDDAGTIQRWVGVNTDVHEQKVAAEGLAGQRARYHALFSQAPVAIGLLRGPDHVIELANPLFCSLQGVTAEQILGRPLLAAIPQLVGQGFDLMLDGVYRTGVAYVGKGVPAVHQRDGARVTIYLDFVYEALRGPHGEVEGVLVIATDVTPQATARLLLEEQHRQSAFAARVGAALTSSAPLRAQLHACCEAVVELGAAFARIWVHDEADDVLVLEASAGRYTHLDGAHARVTVGQFKIGLIASERRPHLTNAVLDDPRVSDPAWARREGMVAFAGYPLVIADRLVGVIALFARQPLSDDTLASLGVVADQLAQAIERATGERFRELFIGILGHDLRNPLSAIQTGAQVLSLDASVPPRPRATAERIIRSSVRMARMVDQLLDYTSARSARGIPVVASRANLIEICREVIAELEQANPGRTIELQHAGDGDGAWDVDRLAQVFSNLIGNALSYGDQRPARVTVRGERDAIEVAVQNHGRPIDPELVPHVFDPFRRANQGRQASTSGLGLGLYITKEILRAHGGTIAVSSTDADGTTFRFSIPRTCVSVAMAGEPPTLGGA